LFSGDGFSLCVARNRDFPHGASGCCMKNRIYRFAQFELNLAESKLSTGNSIVLIQEKPLLLLTALLDNPQRLVTREQLRDRMWDSRTVVNFEQGINVAIKKVRDALGDSAEHPQFIETVAKKGYRFIAPVSIVSEEPESPQLVQLPLIAASPLQSLGGSAKSLRRGAFSSLIAAGILCILGLSIYASQFRPRHAPQIRSLAVLPLQDLSADSPQEYFADGITEEVTTDLAQTLPLRVISRTSVMRYKRTDKPISEIARELGVDAIVEGAVTRSGDRVRVTVQLIDASEDRHLWAHTYERGLEDILAIEAEVSRAIANQVGGTLGLKQAKLVNSRPVDPSVYELCLMGRYHWNKHTGPDLIKAEDYYQQAIARDPGYAPAYAGLANVYMGLPLHGLAPFRDSVSKAAAAAHRAIELDEGLASPHATLGLVAIDTSPEWRHSEPEFRRAIELDPSSAVAHNWLAYYLYFAGRRDEALAEIGLARQLDPLSASTNADEGHFLYATRHFEAAKARLKRAIELAPDLGQSYETLAMVELETGHPADALKDARIGLGLDPTNPRTLGEAGYVLASTGHAAESRETLATLKDLKRRGAYTSTFSAMIEIALGERDQAFESLKEMLYFRLGAGVQALTQWHAFDDLGADSQFQALVANAKL
jgi:TolB-like protein/DNA-binding winged helix-turn-helix (wHTH) protein/Tfp pilus assembly protein PilF